MYRMIETLRLLYDLDAKAIDQRNHRKLYDRLKHEDRQVLELDFGNNPDKLRGEYLDMYEGLKSKVVSATKFDENSVLSTTYLGRIDMTGATKIRAEERFPYQKKGIW